MTESGLFLIFLYNKGPKKKNNEKIALSKTSFKKIFVFRTKKALGEFEKLMEVTLNEVMSLIKVIRQK